MPLNNQNNRDWVNDPIVTLAGKWHEVPTSMHDRGSTWSLLNMDDRKLLAWWEEQRRSLRGARGDNVILWNFELYRDFVRGRKIIEVGPGIGIQGIFFLETGASVTFVDVAPSNLQLIQRICGLKDLTRAQFLPLRSFDDISTLADDYDAVFAGGSLHHAPAEITKPEFQALASRLKPGGRFIFASYPKSRWESDGCPPFDQWGKMTDGEGTPWAEWYDTNKLLKQLYPYRFHSLMYIEYQDGDMNWIDVTRTDGNSEFDDEPIPADARLLKGAVDLSKLTTQPQWLNSSVTLDGTSAIVSAGGARWSYAAEVTVNSRDLPKSEGWLVVSATPRSGVVGIGGVAKDGSTFLAEQYFRMDSRPTSGRKLTIRIASLSDLEKVIVRNAAPAGSSSIAIHSLDIFVKKDATEDA